MGRSHVLDHVVRANRIGWARKFLQEIARKIEDGERSIYRTAHEKEIIPP